MSVQTICDSCAKVGPSEDERRYMQACSWLTVGGRQERVDVCGMDCLVAWALRTRDEDARQLAAWQERHFKSGKRK